jgi:hypothetical protein
MHFFQGPDRKFLGLEEKYFNLQTKCLCLLFEWKNFVKIEAESECGVGLSNSECGWEYKFPFRPFYSHNFTCPEVEGVDLLPVFPRLVLAGVGVAWQAGILPAGQTDCHSLFGQVGENM